jgi:hypothetical protein
MGKSYSPPALDKATATAHSRGDFDFLMPFQKNLLRTDEVSDVIGRSKQFVRELVEGGRLEAHKDSAFGDRQSAVITRRSVILYLAETSNYDPSFLVLRLETLLKQLNGPALARLIQAATKQRERIS